MCPPDDHPDAPGNGDEPDDIWDEIGEFPDPDLAFPEISGTEPIPRDLYFAYQDGPPSTCLVCEESLGDGRPFQIQKAYQGDEVVLEMCLCLRCCNELAREFSAESLEIMRKFLTESFHPGAESSHCHACTKPRESFQGHTVAALCQTAFLLMPEMVICDECNMALEERLSKKTRDVQKDFVRDHFPGIPAGLDLSPSLAGL